MSPGLSIGTAITLRPFGRTVWSTGYGTIGAVPFAGCAPAAAVVPSDPGAPVTARVPRTRTSRAAAIFRMSDISPPDDRGAAPSEPIVREGGSLAERRRRRGDAVARADAAQRFGGRSWQTASRLLPAGSTTEAPE